MKFNLVTPVLFAVWLLFSTLVPAKVVRSIEGREPKLQAAPAVDEQFVIKLYARLLNEKLKEASEYQTAIALLAEDERKIDGQIREEQQRLATLQVAAAAASEKNQEAKQLEAYLRREAESADPAKRRAAQTRLAALQNERRTLDNELNEFRYQVVQTERNITELSQYALPKGSGLGWGPENRQFKTIPEAKQYLEVGLGGVETELSLIRQNYAAWETNRTPQQMAATKNYLIAYAEAKDVSCSVDIMSKRGSQETSEATVKYQTPEQRLYGAKPKSAKKTTKCTDEQMKPRSYYMWTERDGRDTSNRDELIPIASAKEEVTLIER